MRRDMGAPLVEAYGLAMAKPLIWPLVENGEPEIGLRPPEFASILKPASPLLAACPTRRNCPVGSTASPVGMAAVAKGDPETAVNIPDELSIVNAETVVSWEFAVYKNFPLASLAMPWGSFPVVNGEPEIWVNAPELGSIENAEMLLFALTVPDMATYRNLPPPPIAMWLGPGKLACVGKGEPKTGVNAPLVESIV